MVLILLLLAVALALVAGVHYYLWRRLVRDTTAKGGAARRAGTVLIILLGLSTVAAMVGSRALPVGTAVYVAWPGFLWLAMILYLVMALLVGEAVRPLLHRWPRRRPEACAVPAREERVRQPVLAGGERGAAADHAPAAAAGAGPASTGGAPDGGAPGDTEEDADGGSDGDAGSGARSRDRDADRDGALAGTGGTGAPRRLFVARSVALVAGAAATATVGYGVSSALGPPRLKRVTVPLAKLDPRSHGFRIAVVSDIHLGPILGRSHTRRIVDTINRTKPDLVAIVGDLVDGSVGELGRAAEPLAGLESRHGSFFVTGNHEYFSGAEQWVEHVRTLGVHPLENQRTEIGGIDLAGVNDLAGEGEGQGPDFERALSDRDPDRACVLLAHQPVQIHDAVRHRVDLQLSGHTHGGQMWPGPLLAALPNPTVAGLERYGDTQLYVTRGAGFWGPPVRVGAPPDITVVELASPRA